MKLPTLYTRTANGAINFWRIETDGATVRSVWGQEGTDSPQLEEYIAKAKNVGRTNETSPAEQAELEACAKWDKRKRLKYVESIDCAQTHFNLKPMLAHKFDAKARAKLAKLGPSNFPVTVQPKYNGCRCLAYTREDGLVRLMSRGGKDYELPHIANELHERIPEGYALDGELYVHGASLQRIRQLVLTPQPETMRVQFVCYDMTSLPPDGARWQDRVVALAEWFLQQQLLRHVVFSEYASADNAEEIDRLHDFYVKEGYEGAIVRLQHGEYRAGYRSHELLKLKHFQDAEFKVVGWSVGKDGVIVYQCVQEEGITFEVRPVGDEQERAELLRTASSAIGQWLTVKFQERSDRNVPLIVSGLGLRPEEDR